ncbi:GNAT family N-acetyltransferase [Couchioplanes caeruleus]|uniref:GNAT family N-acetyltransferase n=1 Tax=Couchioplanes caeruleus TaxID=56438 RepID=UPI0020C091A2|nr:GNAT family N-acetyltransferase [Couchioplanes caeruleus]UQU66324.1 GNAT family N-acetyltransferase [Couchioplanes caeruleus]
MEIVTARLALRRPAPSDVDAMFEIHSNPDCCRHNPSDLLTDREDAKRLFLRWDDHWRRHSFGYWVAAARDAGAVPGAGPGATVGFCGLRFVRFREREVLNLFYRLDPAYWGTGLATEAADAVVTWAGEHLPEWPILARVRPENVPSQKVAVRAGLSRASHLDEPGEDGPDWMYTIRWPAAGS